MSEMALRFRVEASMAEAKASLDQGAAAFRKFGADANAAMRGAAQGHSALVSQAGMTGNVAAQFNDIGVMLAAGQNPFQLAIQQGTQLGQALQMAGGGVKGATAALKAGFMAMLSPTTLLTIAVIAGGAALVQWAFSAGKTARSAEDAEKALTDLKSILSEFNQNADIGTAKISELREKYGQWASEVRATSQWMAQVNVGQASDALKVVAQDQLNIMAAVNASLVEMTEAQRQYDQMVANGMAATNPAMGALAAEIGRLKEETRLAAAEIGLTTDQVVVLDSVFSAMRGATTMEDIQKRSKEALDAIKAMYPAGQKIPPQVADIAARFQDVYTESTRGLAAMQDMPAALSGATDAAGGLAGAMGTVAAKAIEALNAIRLASNAGRVNGTLPSLGAGPAGMGTAPPSGGAVMTSPLPPRRDINFDHGAQNSGGSGGGGSTSGSLASLSAEAKKALADLDLAVAAINEKVKAGLMSTAQAGDAVNSARQKAGNDIATLIAQIDKLGPAGQAAAAALRVSLQDVTADLKKPIDDLSKSLSEGLSGPLKDFMKNAKTADDVFKAFGDSIIDKLIDIALQQAQTNLFQPLISGFMGSLGGSSGIGASIGEAFGLGGAGARVNPMAGVEAAMGKASASFARSASMETGRSAGGSPGGVVPQVNVKIEGVPAGHTATVDQKSTGMDQMLTVVIERVEAAIGGNIRSGRGSVGAAISDTYGMSRRPR